MRSSTLSSYIIVIDSRIEVLAMDIPDIFQIFSVAIGPKSSLEIIRKTDYGIEVGGGAKLVAHIARVALRAVRQSRPDCARFVSFARCLMSVNVAGIDWTTAPFRHGSRPTDSAIGRPPVLSSTLSSHNRGF